MSAQFTELGVLSELYDSLVAIDLGLTSNLPLGDPAYPVQAWIDL